MEKEVKIGVVGQERKKPLSKRAAMVVVVGEVLSAMGSPYGVSKIDINDFLPRKKEDIRMKTGCKGNFERVREDKVIKKIRGRGKF